MSFPLFMSPTPTTDRQGVPAAVLAAAKSRVLDVLASGVSVVVMDSSRSGRFRGSRTREAGTCLQDTG